jgi:hypothetical protein
MDFPTPEEIRSLCTEQSFERGRNYYHQDRIQEIDIDDGKIRATVRGSSYYDVAIDLTDDAIRTRCSCPYDYAGDCKHIVAVLLAVEDRDTSTDGEPDASEPGESRSETVDVDGVIEDMAADELRSFLVEIIEDDPDIRDRLVAYAGEDTGKTVYDYKQEIDRLFANATSRRGMVEYDTHIDLSQYEDLAETHRERGDIETATDIYRAIAEAFRENLDRVDDSGGYYGRKIERAIESYAETIVEHGSSHEQKRPYIEYLCEAFVEADRNFASNYYDDALRELCTTEDDLEYWLEQLDTRVSNISLDEVASSDPADARSTAEKPDQQRERTDDVLYVSDFTSGPLTPDDFTGGVLDVDHPAVGTLKLEYFVGDAFDQLRVDDPTTVEAHTVTVEPTGSTAGETDITSSLRVRNLISTYIYILEELGEETAVSTLYEQVYLEDSRFCKQYAERLIDEGNDDRAIEVIEDGIETFQSPTGLRWLAADIYRERDSEQYRRTLKQLFLDHTEWEAYDELKETCDDKQWQSRYEEFEQQFKDDRQKLVRMYVHEGDLEKAFAELKTSESLSLVRRYRETVATVDPVEYFELYRELLVPFTAGETGRRHYREIADHLEEMQSLVSGERFETLVDFLKDKHSNRPAFLDELEKAGF